VIRKFCILLCGRCWIRSTFRWVLLKLTILISIISVCNKSCISNSFRYLIFSENLGSVISGRKDLFGLKLSARWTYYENSLWTKFQHAIFYASVVIGRKFSKMAITRAERSKGISHSRFCLVSIGPVSSQNDELNVYC